MRITAVALLCALPTMLCGCAGPVVAIVCFPQSPEEVEEHRRIVADADANAAHALGLLESGEIRAGLTLAEVLERCQPYAINFADRHAFVEFYRQPELGGVLLVAADGKLVAAREWSSNATREFFNTMPPDETRRAYELYE
jgi:hypothetical protein